jgi:hypothetical protein
MLNAQQGAKRINVKLAGDESERSVSLDILPNVYPRDVLRALRLPDRGVELQGEEAGWVFPDDRPLYDAVRHGDTVFVGPRVDAGSRAAMPALVVPSGVPFASPLLVIHSDTRSIVERRGWSRDGGTWHGRYRGSCGCSWRGEIRSSSWRGWEVFIFSPPKQLTGSHEKRTCFSPREGDRWNIHLHQQPDGASVSWLILFVERLLREALGSHTICGREARQW